MARANESGKHLTNPKIEAESACFSFARLDIWSEAFRPVNSGVRHRRQRYVRVSLYDSAILFQ